MFYSRHQPYEDASPTARETNSNAEVTARLIFPNPMKIPFTEPNTPMPKKYKNLQLTASEQNSEVDMRTSTFVKSSIRELLSPMLAQYFRRHFDLSICPVTTTLTFEKQGVGKIRLHQSKFIENNRITYICARCQELNRCCIVGEGEPHHSCNSITPFKHRDMAICTYSRHKLLNTSASHTFSYSFRKCQG